MTISTAGPCTPHGDRKNVFAEREKARQASLHAYAVLDTPAEEAFDDFTAMASQITGTPIALISLLDCDRQWFKSRVGIETVQTPRAWAFCDHTIREEGILEVPDATQDVRFANNPLVVGEPDIRFYAGAPLVTPDGHAVGTLCVIDREPRRLSEAQQDTLRRLARQVVHLLELRRLARRHAEIEEELRQREAERARLALVAERTSNTVLMTDGQGRITWLNDAFCKAYGLSEADCQGKLPSEVDRFPALDPHALGVIQRARTDRCSAKVRIRCLDQASHIRWVDLDLQPIFNNAGEYQGQLAVGADVTELVVQRDRTRALLEALPVAVLALNRDLVVQEANTSALQMLGVLSEALVGEDLRKLPLDTIGADHCPLPVTQNPAYLTIQDGQARSDVVVGVRLGHTGRRWLQLSTVTLASAGGGIDGAILCAMDVTEQRLQSQFISLAMQAARIVPWELSIARDEVHFDPTAASTAGLRLPGLEQGSGIASAFGSAVHPEDRAHLQDAFRQLEIDGGGVMRAEFRLPGRDGHWNWMLLVGAATERTAEGTVRHLKGILLDISDRKRAEHALRVAATTDQLTGLPNRSVLSDRLHQALASARRHGCAGALLFIDLDHFKRVNDVHGHLVGDEVLRQATKLLKSQLRQEDTLARMGGDEFIVLLPHAGSSLESAAAAAEFVGGKLLHAISTPISTSSCQIDIGASIGFTVFPKSSHENEDDLIREADTAMYVSKASGRGTQSVYAVGMHQDLSHRLELEHDLRHAIERNELQIHLQGKWHPDGRLLGAEALLRWHHPVRGSVSPAEFIAIAEESSLILNIGRWVFEQACAWLAARLAEGHTLPVAVNVSPRQFRHSPLPNELLDIATAAGVSPTLITLEITEGVLLDEGARQQLNKLADAGFRISIDDFGTGYSSLLYLKRLPVHEIKIDKGFVHGLGDDPEDAVLIEAMLAMADSFGIDVVAEGVETARQASFLASRGCFAHQGYYYDRPCRADHFKVENGASVGGVQL